jgi:rhodanese-related sulfurtransferase
MKPKLFSPLFLALILTATFAAPAMAQQGDVATLARAYFAELPSDNNAIKADKLFSMMRAGEDMHIIDVRRPEDYAKAHLKGAVNLPFFDDSITDALADIPDDKPVFVHCYTGQAAAQVTVLLNIAGKQAKSIQSGFDNGIAKTEGYEKMLAYPVDAAVTAAVAAYFKNKAPLDGSLFANFNLSPRSVKCIVDEKKDNYLIVSVRRADDYAKGHIPTALNIPFGKGMEEKLAALPRDKKIVVHCYTGQTGSQTMAVLRMMGYDAYSMSGGMDAWLKEGYAVVAGK